MFPCQAVGEYQLPASACVSHTMGTSQTTVFWPIQHLESASTLRTNDHSDWRLASESVHKQRNGSDKDKQQHSKEDTHRGLSSFSHTFNKANLKTVLPKFYPHVKCSTRGGNTLDHVYSNIKHAYRAIPLLHLGQSDHLSLLLSPA